MQQKTKNTLTQLAITPARIIVSISTLYYLGRIIDETTTISPVVSILMGISMLAWVVTPLSVAALGTPNE